MEKLRRLASSLQGRGIAVLLFIGLCACYALTIFMNRNFGASIGATAEGKVLLGGAAVVIEVVGVGILGLAAGAIARAERWYVRLVAVPMGFVVLVCAGVSVMSITGFVASERLAVSQAREAHLAAITERTRKKEQDAKERREAQERLAQSGLGFMQSQLKDATKKERRVLSKDFASGAAQIIGEIGKETQSKEDQPEPIVILHTDGQAEIIADITGLDAKLVRTFATASIAGVLIALETILSPLTGYFWGRKITFAELVPLTAPTALIEKTPISLAVASAPLALAGSAVGAPAALAMPGSAESPPIPLVANDAGKPAAGLPEPVPAPQPEPNPFLDNAPIPGSEASLRAINFSFDGRPEGQQRTKDKPKISAKRFAIVCQAYGQTGAFWADEMQKLYRQFCQADHREATSMRDVYSALQGLPETIVQYGKVRINPDSDNKAARYTVVPARYVKPKAAPEKTPPSTAAPKEVGDGKSGPFSVASSAAENEPAPAVAKPRLTVVPTRSFLPENERWEIATARSLKGQMRGFSRKQRGSRMHKLARAA